MIRGPAEAAEAFENARGHVGRRRIEHRVVIGEWNVIEKTLAVVAIEGSPTAVAILHAEQPLDAAANGGFHPLRIGELYTLEGHQHESGIVHIGIEVVAEFEDPSAGRGVFVFHLPVAGTENLPR